MLTIAGDFFFSTTENRIGEILIGISEQLILITAPIFFIYLIPIKRKRAYYSFFSILFTSNLILSGLAQFLFTSLLLISQILFTLSFGLMLLFITVLFIKNYSKIQSKAIQAFIKFASVLALIFFPLIFLFDVVLTEFTFTWFSQDIDMDVLFFITWNLSSIVFFLRYFNSYVTNSFLIEYQSGYLDRIGLSQREREVFYSLIKGSQYKQIAQELNISPVTVKTHVLNIYKKAQVKNRLSLIQKIKEDRITKGL